MKILLVHNYYSDRGGEDIAFDYQKRLLKNYGCSVIEYSKKSSDVDNLFKKAYISINSFYSKKIYKEVKKIILGQKPDIAHIHNIFPVISPSIYDVLYDNDIPIIQTIHSYRFFCANGLCLKNGEVCTKCEKLSIKNIFNSCRQDKKFYDFLLSLNLYIIRKRNVFGKISHFIALSNFVKEKLIKVGVDYSRISTIRNIFGENNIDTNIVKKIEDKKYFIYIGRLSREKGILELIKVFSNLPGINIKVLGDGPLYNKIKEKIETQGNGNIEILGYVGGSEKYKLLSSAYAVIIPSICFEVSPLTIIESFQFGVPVIVNNIGSLPENVIDGENGYIYNDLDELKDKILKVISLDTGQTKIMADECKASYEKLFNKNMNFNLLTNLYNSILDKNFKNNVRKN